jgi:uncharacterized protein YegP (UPF0339 family)
MAGRRARFEVYEGHHGDWYWRLRASNGKIIADSAEGYRRKRAAIKAVNRVGDVMLWWPHVEVKISES